MARMTDADTEAADRWAKATRIAEGITDYGISKALRPYFLVYLPLGVLVLTGIGYLILALIFGNVGEEWPEYLGAGLMLAGIGVIIGGFVYASKKVKPEVRPQRGQALVWLEKPEQKRIRKQIYGRIPPVPEELTVARGAAVQLRQGLAQGLLLIPGYLLIFVPQLVSARDGFLGVLWISLLGLLVAVAIVTVWQFHQTTRFLERTAASAPRESPRDNR
jgi:hypothetical protein